jgi:hypothetical protein
VTVITSAPFGTRSCLVFGFEALLFRLGTSTDNKHLLTSAYKAPGEYPTIRKDRKFTYLPWRYRLLAALHLVQAIHSALHVICPKVFKASEAVTVEHE